MRISEIACPPVRLGSVRVTFKGLLFGVLNLRGGGPHYLVSSFVHAVERLPCTLCGASSVPQ